MRTARTYIFAQATYAVVLAMALCCSDVGPPPGAPPARPRPAADHAHGRLPRMRALTLPTLRGGGHSAQVCVCVCARASACLRARACVPVTVRAGVALAAYSRLVFIFCRCTRSLCSPRSRSTMKHVTLWVRGTSMICPVPKICCRGPWRLRLPNSCAPHPMAAAARDAAFTVDLALTPAYERINAVALPPVSCPASSCSHELPRFPPRPPRSAARACSPHTQHRFAITGVCYRNGSTTWTSPET